MTQQIREALGQTLQRALHAVHPTRELSSGDEDRNARGWRGQKSFLSSSPA